MTPVCSLRLVDFMCAFGAFSGFGLLLAGVPLC